MTDKVNNDSDFIETTLLECLAEFKNVAEIDPTLDDWLLNRFRTNFQVAFKGVSSNNRQAVADWLKKQTKAMAHFAVASALTNERPIMANDLKASVDLIREHNPQCKQDEGRGRFCI